MGIGSASREVIVGASPAAAFDRVQRALADVGKVAESDETNFFVRGTTRYGLQKVRIKCQVSPSGENARVEIKALGDDVWGKAAKEGIRKIVDALGAL